MAPRALVFDVDGTLIDTLDAMHQALNEQLAALQRPDWSRDRVRDMLSGGLDGLLAAALSDGEPVADDALPALRAVFHQRYATLAPTLARSYTGAGETLHRLRKQGLRLAVCSNASGSALSNLLQRRGWLELFETIVHADNAPALKPSPLPLQAVLDRLGLAACQAWMIGDSALDARCAQAAGCRFVWFGAGYGRLAPQDTVFATIERLAQLPGIVRDAG
jgi:phosphoglycolate phosphatase